MKKILAMLLAVVMVFGLVACTGSDTTTTTGNAGNNGGNAGNNGGEATVTEVTLKVWAPSEDQAEGNSWLAAMEEAFAAAHPEYKITWVNEVCSEGDAGGLVTGDVSAAGDVYMFANDQLGTLINAGALSQLGGIYEEQVKTDNAELLVNTVTHTDGGIYGFPMTNNTWFCYYDKSVYSEEDVKSLETMLSKGKVAFPWGVGWYGGAFFLGNGGTIFGPNGNDADAGIQFGGENGYAAAAAMIALANNPNMVNDENELGIAALKDRSVAACFSGSWKAAELKEALGEDLGAVQLPTFKVGDKDVQMMSFAGTKCVGVNQNTKNAKVATQFAAYLASTEGQLKRYEMRGIIPAAKTLAEDPTIAADVVAVAELNTMANTAVIQSALSGMNNYWTPMSTFCNGCLNGDINMDNYKDQVDLLMQQLNAESL